MNITPVNYNFCGKYYDFKHNDPRKDHPDFRLGMDDKEVVENVSCGDNYFYPFTAEQLRAIYIRQQGYDYEPYYPDEQVVATLQGTDDDSHARYTREITAGDLRREIMEEEKDQLWHESQAVLAKYTYNKPSEPDYSQMKPWWETYPY